MELSILLAKVIGIYAIVKGVAILFKKEECRKMVHEFIDSYSATIAIGAVELIAGLFIVNTHNVWTGGFPVVITVIGWIAVIDGLLAVLLPHKTVAKFYKRINTPAVYNIGIAVSLVLGVYLTYAGFGY